MCLRLSIFAVLLLLLLDESRSWYNNDHYRHNRVGRNRDRQIVGYKSDWDRDWDFQSQRDTESDTRVRDRKWNLQTDPDRTLPPVTDTRGIYHTYQYGSAIIPYKGATVHVVPSKGRKKAYRGTITSSIINGNSQRRSNGHRLNHHHKYKQAKDQSRDEDNWRVSHDQPARPQVCAKCPSDRAVVSKRGANSVIMESPPIVPCYPWSNVNGVRLKVVQGPRPGTRVGEGSHQLVVVITHYRRRLKTCHSRYNVIVRKCPQLEVGFGVLTHCPHGSAWGAQCNISCEDGYQLDGPAFTECTDDLEWSGVTPQCIATTACPVPVSPANGHLSCRTPQHQPVRPKGMLPDGTVCHYRCDPGYNIPPSEVQLSTVRCIAGSWDSSQDPTCIESNSLDETEVLPEDHANLVSTRFGIDPNCPKDLCENGGNCIILLGEPACSCINGYSGLHCTEHSQDIPNYIT